MTNKSMYDFLFANYDEKKDDVAVCFLYKNFSYRFLKNEIDKVACFLVEQGIKKGDVVTVALPNIPSSVSVFYAVNKIMVLRRFRCFLKYITSIIISVH